MSDETRLAAAQALIRAIDQLLEAVAAYYHNWCERSGEEESLSQKAYGDAMTERGFDRQKNGGVKWYLGIALSEQK
jgi:hypothetical protein